MRAFEQGKAGREPTLPVVFARACEVNIGVDGTLVKSRHMPEPLLEANEA